MKAVYFRVCSGDCFVHLILSRLDHIIVASVTLIIDFNKEQSISWQYQRTNLIELSEESQEIE